MMVAEDHLAVAAAVEDHLAAEEDNFLPKIE
jgi:hypothetical protein